MPLFPFSKKANNYRPISVLNNISKIFEIIIHENVLHQFQSHFNSCQHGFIKSNSTSTNIIAYPYFITSLVHSQRQVYAIYFDFSSAFDLVTYPLLLRKINDFELSPSSTVTSPTDYPMFSILKHLRHRMNCYLVHHKDHFWEHFFLVFSYTACVVWSNIQIAFSLPTTLKDIEKQTTPYDSWLLQ